MKDMVARQLLRSRHQVLPANNADIIRRRQFFGRGVRIQRVHVVNGSPGQYNVAERFLEIPYGIIHGPECEQR